jgi:type II secretory pathway pseudopilin PulG
MNMKHNGYRAYTAIEIVLIILLLALLGTIVTPGASLAFDNAKNSRLQKDLRLLRAQIERYRSEHGGMGPHVNENGEFDPEKIIARMTGTTYVTGKISNYAPLGPYIQDWPANPFCDGLSAQSITFGNSSPPPYDGTSGWYFNLTNRLVSPNHLAEGRTESATAFKTFPATIDKKTKTPVFRLQGLMSGPDGAEAIINDRHLHVGDVVGDITITDIGTNWVQMEQNGKPMRIELPPFKGEELDASLEAQKILMRLRATEKARQSALPATAPTQ